MKVGLIKQSYTAQGGGSERYTNGLIAQLLTRGHRVRVLAARWDAAAAATGGELQRVPRIAGLSLLRTFSFALKGRRAVEPCPLRQD